MSIFSQPEDFLKRHLLISFKVRFKRLINEGFGGFVVSITLLTLGLMLVRYYWIKYQALQDDIKTEILATVGTPQEPADTANQLGLIAAALAKVNRDAKRDEDGGVTWTCEEADRPCKAVEDLQDIFARKTQELLVNHKQDKQIKLARFPMDQPGVYRPELAEGRLCVESNASEKTNLMMPAQMSSLESLPRVQTAIYISSPLDAALREIESKYDQSDSKKSIPDKRISERLVQAYFISPDSVLRIWNSRKAHACSDLPASRLWASKSYFAFFWEHPKKNTYGPAPKIETNS